MSHDYDLPADWDAMTDEEKCEWMTAERSRRQAMRQDTSASRKIKKAQERLKRRAESRSHTVSLEEYR